MFSNRKILLVIALLVAVCLAAYVLLVVIPRRVAEQSYEGARKIGRDFRELFQATPQITVNNRVIVQREADILEVAAMAQQFHHRYQWTNTRFGSTKKIEVSGAFESKAGFDINEAFAIDIQDGRAVITMPEPRILSVSLLGDLEFRDEGGLWNWVDNDDRNRAINAFMEDARRHARRSMNRERMKQTLAERLAGIVGQHVREVEVRVGDEIVRPSGIPDPG
ncbi:MAG TPA: DUF4230 domain-containing protein [Cyclobacteriaceae bacterium]|nr:DUF4230 domain-containing protein [Cyclobacteriaceae bacterium]